jgi:hypothetical protein
MNKIFEKKSMVEVRNSLQGNEKGKKKRKVTSGNWGRIITRTGVWSHSYEPSSVGIGADPIEEITLNYSKMKLGDVL